MTERDRRFSHCTFDSLSNREWVAMLGFYRVLRIRISQGPLSDGERANGCSYGMTRDEARRCLYLFVMQLDWHAYLGSK